MFMKRRDVLIVGAAIPLLSTAMQTVVASSAMAATPDFSGVKTIA